MKILAITIGKITIFIGRIMHRGSSLPGKIALKIDKNLLKKITYPKVKIAVTGSSGKGSTATLIAKSLAYSGATVTFNKEGSNLAWGVTTSFLSSMNLFGKIKTDYLVLEVDERYAKNIFSYLNPTHIVITNLTKDQPPRNFYVDFVYNEIKNSIPHDAKLITNIDSPYMQKFALDLPNEVSYFSIGENKYSYHEQIFENLNTYYCPKCLTRLNYSYYNFESMGAYNCPNCDFKYHLPRTIGKNLDLTTKTITINGELINLNGDMLYDAYNMVCAFHVLHLLGIKDSKIAASLNSIKENNTKISFNSYNKNFNLLYCKCENAPTFNQALFKIREDKDLKDIIIGWKYITIRYPHHDISWIYDITFEILKTCNVNKIYVIGISKEDLKVRMLLAGIEPEKIVVASDLKQIKDEIINSRSSSVYGILNYDYHEPFPFESTFKEEK